MQIATFVMQYAGLTLAQLRSQVVIQLTPDGKYSFPVWNVPGVQKPTETQIELALGQPSIPELGAALIAAAKTTADAVTEQILTAETHVAGYTNAAAWVIAAGGGAPANDPAKTAFATMAASNGCTPAVFATLVETLSVSAMVLSGALTAVSGGAEQSTSIAQLQAVLTGFEAAIAAEVTAINAAFTAASLPISIVAPPAIVVPEING